jgi:DNA-binding transcriptional ArsR family regulator
MALVVELGVADLAASRFAISPLCETIKALLLLAQPAPPEVNLAWVRWARVQLEREPLRVPTVWPLVVNGLSVYPEFLVPAPAVRHPAFADELARLAGTPATAVRASLCRVFGGAGAPGGDRADGGRTGDTAAGDPAAGDLLPGPASTWPGSAVDLFGRPAETLARIAAELAECHRRLLAPYWERINSVLEADIGYRTGLLASGGLRSLFRDMHPDLHWSAGTLTLADADTGPSEVRVQLGPDGLVIIPSVFVWPVVSVSKATSTQTVMVYPARGSATVWYGTEHQDASGTAAENLLGSSRARLLAALRSPASTTSLARQLGVTPGAVSQQLAFLHRGGLVARRQSGRTVLYQATELGLSLLVRVS